MTFEINPYNTLSIIGILEAIAHREAAHRTYVLYATSRTLFDGAPVNERIMELAQKFGIGVVLTEQLGDVES